MRTIADDEITVLEGEVEDAPEVPSKHPITKKYLKTLRAMGLTYKQIAEKCGSTENYIKKWFYEDRKKEAEKEANKRPVGRPPGSKNKRTLAEESLNLANWEKKNYSPALREDKAELNKASSWFALECYKLGATADTSDIENMKQHLIAYMELCARSGMPAMPQSARLALGVHASTLKAWKSGKHRSDDPRYKEFVEDLMDILQGSVATGMATGAIDRVVGIWTEKSQFGESETANIQVDITDPLGEKRSATEIVKAYENLPD